MRRRLLRLPCAASRDHNVPAIIAHIARARARTSRAARPGGLSPLTPCGQRAACSTVAAMISSWARCPQGLETARMRQAISWRGFHSADRPWFY